MKSFWIFFILIIVPYSKSIVFAKSIEELKVDTLKCIKNLNLKIAKIEKEKDNQAEQIKSLQEKVNNLELLQNHIFMNFKVTSELLMTYVVSRITNHEFRIFMIFRIIRILVCFSCHIRCLTKR